MKARVLLVHGLWMQTPALLYWAMHLRRAGFEPVYFSYKSLLEGPDSALARLRQAALEKPGTHIIAHSLGGLVALKALAGESAFSGHIICVGSPLCGSRTARAMASHHIGRMAGRSLPLLCQGLQQVPEGLLVSAIAGTKPNGLGRLLQRFDEPSDGTVALSETKIPGLHQHITVPVSHSGQLFSKTVLETALVLLKSPV
jgi:pimeloyl-ACP methyl ester carboxylesterase